MNEIEKDIEEILSMIYDLKSLVYCLVDDIETEFKGNPQANDLVDITQTLLDNVCSAEDDANCTHLEFENLKKGN